MPFNGAAVTAVAAFWVRFDREIRAEPTSASRLPSISFMTQILLPFTWDKLVRKARSCSGDYAKVGSEPSRTGWVMRVE